MKRRYKILFAVSILLGVPMVASYHWFYYYRPLDTEGKPLAVTEPEQEFLNLANRARQDRKLKLVRLPASSSVGLFKPEWLIEDIPGSGR